MTVPARERLAILETTFLRRIVPSAFMVPALLVGVLVMRQHGVATMLWGLNLLAGAAGIGIAAAVRPRGRGIGSARHHVALALLGMAMLAGTFASAGLQGVHRWIPLGPLTLYAGPIALPMVILAAGALMVGSEGRVRWSVVPVVTAAGLLVAQPDAAQATGLLAAALVLWLRRPVRGVHAMAVVAVALLAAWSWTRPDPLAPVPHVEGILGLAARAGTGWLVVAAASLALLPLPFFLRGRDAHPWAHPAVHPATVQALGAHLVVCILVPLVRAYPVPVLGYGVSPVIGYLIAATAIRGAR